MLMPEHWGQLLDGATGFPSYSCLFMAAMGGSGDDGNWPPELLDYNHQAA